MCSSQYVVSLLHWQPSPARWRKFSGEVAGFSRACGKFSPVYAKWRLTFSRTTYGYPMDIARRYIREDTEEAAKARGQELLALYEANYVDVIRVAC